MRAARQRFVDPAWIARANRIYGGLLLLYPAQFRRDYAGCLQQAFRDRCREVARGERGFLQFLLGEILPDFFTSVCEEQRMAFSLSSSRRLWGWIGALALTLLLVASADRIGRWYWDNYNPQRLAADEYLQRSNEDREHLHQFIGFLTRPGRPADKALALYLQAEDAQSALDPTAPEYRRTLQEIYPQVARLASASTDMATLHILLHVCELESVRGEPVEHCDSMAIAHRILSLKPDDAVALGSIFNQALQARDFTTMNSTIAALAMADFDSLDSAGSTRYLLQQVAAFDPNDRHLLRILASETSYVSFTGGISLLKVRDYCEPTGLVEDTGLREDCRRIAARMRSSGSLHFARIGTSLSYRLADEPERAELLAEYRDRLWLNRQMQTAYVSIYLHDYVDESADAETSLVNAQRWQEAWRNAGNETEAVQKLLTALRMSPLPPRSFTLSKDDMARLTQSLKPPFPRVKS